MKTFHRIDSRLAAGLILVMGFVFGATSVNATEYVWTGAIDKDLTVAGNWLVGGVVPGAAPASASANQPETPTINDTIVFDSTDPGFVQGMNSLYFRGPDWGSFEVRNGTVNGKGDANSKANGSWSGTDTFVVGDGDNAVAAVMNSELVELNNGTASGSPNTVKTYVIRSDGTLRNGQSATSVLKWSNDATQDTVMRILGGASIIDGYITEAPLTGDAGDYVTFEAPGSTFTAGFGGAGQFPDIASVRAHVGDGLSFRGTGGNSVAAQDNGNGTFTIYVDNTAPTLAATDIQDDKSGGPMDADTPVAYSLTFSEEMAVGSLTAVAFTNSAATTPSAYTFVSMVQENATNYTVTIQPTAAGNLRLQVTTNATDLAGHGLPAAVDDLETLVVQANTDPPTITLDGGAAGIGAGTATLRGLMTAGAAAQAYFCWGTTSGGTVSTGAWQNVISVGDAYPDVSFSNTLSGLIYGFEYSYAVYATNAYGDDWSGVDMFVTHPPAGDALTPTAGADIFLDASLDPDSGVNGTWEDTLGTWDVAINGPTYTADAGSSLPGIGASYDLAGHLSGTGGFEGASLQTISVDTKPISLEIWFKPDDGPVTPLNGQVLWETGGGTGFGIFYNDGNAETAHDSNAGRMSTDVSSLTNEFIQVVVTYDTASSTENYKLYVNGQLRATSSRSDTDMCGGDASGLGERGATNVGGAGGGDSGTESLDGQIAIFRAYHDQILSSNEVAANYASIAVTPAAPLSIINGSTSNVSEATADIAGTLSGAQSVFTVYAYVSTNTNPSISAWTNDTSALVYSFGTFTNVSDYPVGGTVTGLLAETDYYYTLTAANDVTNLWATPNKTFTTLEAAGSAPPLAGLDGGATGIGIGTATLRGVVSSGAVSQAYICWGDEDGGTGSTGDWQYVESHGSVFAGTSFSNTITELLYGLEYSYRVYATNGYGDDWSGVDTFTTLAPTSYVVISNTVATDIGETTADLQGTLDATQTVFDVYVYWSTTSNSSASAWTGDGTASNRLVNSYTNVVGEPLSLSVTGLSGGLTYYYAFMATNAATNIWASPNAEFTTVSAPSVSHLGGATDVGGRTATLNGQLTAGVAAEVYFCWDAGDKGDVSTGAWENVISVGLKDQGVAFSTALSGLELASNYAYRCYAVNAAGTAWSGVDTFTTLATPTYTWTGGAGDGNWTNAANWDANGVAPQDAAGADIVFSPSTSGILDEDPSTNRVTLGSLTWSSSFSWRIGSWYANPQGITIDTGDASAATAMVANGAVLDPYYVRWLLNSDLVISGDGTLNVHAPGGTVSGSGGFIINSGAVLQFVGTHTSTHDYTYTGGVTIRSGGVVDVNKDMSQLGDGLVTIEEGGELQAHNSAFDQDVTIVLASDGANPPVNAPLITGGGAALVLSGSLSFNVDAVTPSAESQWQIISATASYGPTFSVGGATEADGVWARFANGFVYEFDESTGTLSARPPAGSIFMFR